MSLLVVFCLVLATTSNAARVLSRRQTETVLRHAKEFPVEDRHRRGVPSLLVQAGTTATDFLLNGAKKLRSRSNQHNRFEKPGDFDTALKDFYSLKPRGVQVHTRGTKVTKLTGQVGNRQIIVSRYHPAAKMPSLEIRNPNAAKYDLDVNLYTILGEPYDRILYKNKRG